MDPAPVPPTDLRPAPFAAATRAAGVLRERVGVERFDVAVVLGSGLGTFADALDDSQRLPMADLPGFTSPGRGRARG